MTTVLIADQSKPSIVMTSEVFKDKIQGTCVHVASTGKEMLEKLKEMKPDICVIDFDLPDVDGPALIQMARKIYDGPILLTAFPTPIVQEAVNSELFAYHDASDWIPKPVSFDVLSDKIDTYLIKKHRINKRFNANLQAKLIGKAEGRGKRSPKVNGKMINISLNGACIELKEPMKVKKAQEFLVTITPEPVKASKHGKSSKSSDPQATVPISEAKIKATIAWQANKNKIGLKFSASSSSQKNEIESFIRQISKRSAQP
ncbi:MAG: response regulator [Oligoflexales bacterium]|nr:response regulator [Oligoflexales bacterium]